MQFEEVLQWLGQGWHDGIKKKIIAGERFIKLIFPKEKKNR